MPGVVLTPAEVPGPRPAILFGHGMGDHKRSEPVLAIAGDFVRRYGWAVAVIDGPFHGDRTPPELLDPHADQDAARRRLMAAPGLAAAMAADWSAVLNALAELPECGAAPAGYFGVSMGTVIGVPVVAAEPRIRCAVFTIGGIRADTPLTAGTWLSTAAMLASAARIGARPVLMLNQSEDEFFSREHAFLLYDALTGPKHIIFFPGLHGEQPPEALAYAGRFFARHLANGGDAWQP